MKKKLIIINGTMGVGKSTISKALYKNLENSVWLDGDWCWMMNPFVVNDENKKMVEDNIVYLLSNFLRNSSLEYVVFNWVIHEESIFELLLNRLKDFDFELYKITLICSEEVLRNRIIEDFKNGRGDRNLENSLKRLELYKNMDTIKIDTSNKKIDETIEEIINIINP
ncbi:AAA family ATPase [Clostridium intestinale]|uniref:Putative nucleotide kinase n=1 Tax=Clostridium intestinale URNW TaxID=1294142 RepID=U2PYZ0_9CLOT|nr:AAA family ATPase [Clostridium intestinale]ERK28999.1 putative nucleotide kinase [Clostridium intestinale URNW]